MEKIYKEELVREGYERAKEVYKAFGVDTDEVLKQMDNISISLHCWQGDDVTGFEEDVEALSGGGILLPVIIQEELEMARS